MNLLILGGTGEAKRLAMALHESLSNYHGNTPDITIIYSVAGLVRIPKLPSNFIQVISGGFRQYATKMESAYKHNGLANYVQRNNITAILDVTHPYANNMSESAALAAKTCSIPYWRYHRPPWEAQAGDDWTHFNTWNALLLHLVAKNCVFFSSGQVSEAVFETLDKMLNGKQQIHVLRTAVKPQATTRPNIHWIKSIGPFSYDDEIALLKQHKIDVIVTKNSGGKATIAKLEAARTLNIPVLMLNRPDVPTADHVFTDITACQQFILDYLD